MTFTQYKTALFNSSRDPSPPKAVHAPKIPIRGVTFAWTAVTSCADPWRPRWSIGKWPVGRVPDHYANWINRQTRHRHRRVHPADAAPVESAARTERCAECLAHGHHLAAHDGWFRWWWHRWCRRRDQHWWSGAKAPILRRGKRPIQRPHWVNPRAPFHHRNLKISKCLSTLLAWYPLYIYIYISNPIKSKLSYDELFCAHHFDDL